MAFHEFVPAVAETQFSPFHVETLLNQSADLLDRCLRERYEWQEKAAKFAHLGVEIADFVENDKIHQEEIQAGIYAVPYACSSAEADGYKQAAGWTADAVHDIMGSVSKYFSGTGWQTYFAATQREQWAGHINPYAFPAFVNVTFDGVSDSVPNHCMNAASDMATWMQGVQVSSLNSQALSMIGQQQINYGRRNSLSAKSKYDQVDIDFKLRRVGVAKRLADLKSDWATAKDGLLNFHDQMLSSSARLARDMRDALARVAACASGLASVYGYNVPLPASISGFLLAGSGASDVQLPNTEIDDITAWIRNAIAWMIRFSESDDTYIMALSIRGLTGPQEWAKGIRSGIWQVPLGEEWFPNQHYVRLRSVAIIAEGERRVGSWAGRLRAPLQSFYVHGDGAKVSVDQSGLRSCRLGRVGAREQFREPERCGAQVLHNAGPFGAWELSLNELSTAGERRRDLGDLIFEIHVASQTQIA